MEEEMTIVLVIDTTMAEAQARAKQYIAQANAKPECNETEGECLLALRTLCSREMKIDKREAKGEKTNRDTATTMTPEEVGTAEKHVNSTCC